VKKDNEFYREMQRYITVTTIGPSTLRNQGSKGVIIAAQNHLAVIDLEIFRINNETELLKTLDVQTEALKKAFPREAQNWGSARKALNLFLREICYNRFLCERYFFADIEEWMEIPLDSLVATALKRKGERGRLPKWPGLNRLTPECSAKFQEFAKQIAKKEGISRVHLDMRLWLKWRKG
jgi:hypothetical protein